MEDNRPTIIIEQMSELYGVRSHPVARRTRFHHWCYDVTGISAGLAGLIVVRRQLNICQRDLQWNCAQLSLFSVDEWRRQRLSAGPRAVSQILRLTSTSTTTTLGFFRF